MYYIDKKVIELLHPDSGPEQLDKLFDVYLQTSQVLINNYTKAYLRRNLISEERINSFFEAMNSRSSELMSGLDEDFAERLNDAEVSDMLGLSREFAKQKNLPSTESIPGDYRDIEDLLEGDEYKNWLDYVQNEYNKKYYDEAQSQLSEEQKGKLNQYLEGIDEKNKAFFDRVFNDIAQYATMLDIQQEVPDGEESADAQAATQGAQVSEGGEIDSSMGSNVDSNVDDKSGLQVEDPRKPIDSYP